MGLANVRDYYRPKRLAKDDNRLKLSKTYIREHAMYTYYIHVAFNWFTSKYTHVSRERIYA